MLSHSHLEMEQKELRTILDFIPAGISFRTKGEYKTHFTYRTSLFPPNYLQDEATAQLKRSDALLHFFSDTILYLENHLPLHLSREFQ